MPVHDPRSYPNHWTVRVAGLLVALPIELVTVTVNAAPLSTADVADMVYVVLVAPVIFAPFLCH